jgi:hypothetical protein
LISYFKKSNLMKRNFTKIIFVLFIAITSIIMVTIVSPSSFCANNQGHTDTVDTKSIPAEVPEAPMIIWFQDIETGPEALELAMSGGIFSHVMLEGVNQLDRANYFTKRKFRQALEVLRKHKNVKVIWCRWLFPGHKLDKFKFEDIFDPQYYVRQIRQIKEEAKIIGADFVAFDSEPYANCPLQILPHRKLLEPRFNILRDAIKTAVKTEGQVDYIMPADFQLKGRYRHLYSATFVLGKTVIAEHTYRDVPRMREDKRRPYDIFGAYVSIKKEDPQKTTMPYFTPREILERQNLWAHKKGLFIFPGIGIKNITAVAREFSKIKYIQPLQDSNSIY